MPGISNQCDRRGAWIVLLVAALLANGVVVNTRAFALNCLAAVNTPGCMHGLPLEQYQAALAQMGANPVPVRRFGRRKTRFATAIRERNRPHGIQLAGSLFDAASTADSLGAPHHAAARASPVGRSCAELCGRYTPVYLCSLKADGGLVSIGALQWPGWPGAAYPRWQAGGVAPGGYRDDLQVLTAYEMITVSPP
jgi:hypothetical protein